MYSKDMIIEEMKRIAQRLGSKSLKQTDFEENSTIHLSTVKYYMGTWRSAIKEAGLQLEGSIVIIKKKDLIEGISLK